MIFRFEKKNARARGSCNNDLMQAVYKYDIEMQKM